jgi:DNA-binding response OmpR family regulator
MYRILIIDDSPIMQKLLRKILPAEGYECMVAGAGAAGLSACAAKKPDLVLLDVNLPDGNGIDICRSLKSDLQLRHIPVLLLTGEAQSVEDRIAGLEAGADDYVIKPFNVKELLSRVKGILKSSARPTRL